MHWGRNYGALLQAYALQEYLLDKGYDVEIINYKPKKFDVNYFYYLTHPWRIKDLIKVELPKEAIEKQIAPFRESNLKQTKRYYSYEELVNAEFDYDVYITGSDQILNPALTLSGDGKPAPVYYLGFAPINKRCIGYAVSFGCTIYPEPAKQYASKWIKKYHSIGVRENSGLSILESFSTTAPAMIVPDPTILLGRSLFRNCNLNEDKTNGIYYYIHVLRSKVINYGSIDGVKCIDGEKIGAISLTAWLNYIYNSEALITNSYHAMIMAILMHRKFVVILEEGVQSGMNDRFYTLLSKIGLENRIAENDSLKIREVLQLNINWDDVDKKVEEFRVIGEEFLKNNLLYNNNDY